MFYHIYFSYMFIPRQRKLMGSSAQNSSGVRWCRCRVKFNEGSGEGSGEGSRKPWCKAKSGLRRRFRRRSGRLWCRARSSSTGPRRKFRRRFREALVQSYNRVPEKVLVNAKSLPCFGWALCGRILVPQDPWAETGTFFGRIGAGGPKVAYAPGLQFVANVECCDGFGSCMWSPTTQGNYEVRILWKG